MKVRQSENTKTLNMLTSKSNTPDNLAQDLIIGQENQRDQQSSQDILSSPIRSRLENAATAFRLAMHLPLRSQSRSILAATKPDPARSGFQASLAPTSGPPKSAAPSSQFADAVIIGSGVSGQLVLGHLAVTRKELPKEQRGNLSTSKGQMNFITVGPRKGWGGGTAYSKAGYSRNEPMNVLPHQVAFKAEAPNPIDGNFLKQTVDVEERRLRNERPYQFATPFYNRENETNYSYVDTLGEKYSPQRYLSSGQFLRKDYGQYVNDSVNKALRQSRRVHAKKVYGNAVAVKHDAASQTFTVLVDREGKAQPLAITTPNVVLATGHGHLEPFPGLEGLDGTSGYHTGSNVYRFIDQIRSRPNNFRSQKGLIIGSGLTMNDAANALLSQGINSFKVVSSRGLTHELPHAVPPQSELVEISDRIAALLNPRTLALGQIGNDSYVRELRIHFDQARNLAEQYKPHSPTPLTIRGQEFDRQQVYRALLSQYVVFRYEGMRGNALRERFGEDRAAEIAHQAIELIDKPNSTWITTVRAPTTDQNIRTNRILRERGMVLQRRVHDVVSEDNRLRVDFGNQHSMLVDYVIDARGREATFSRPLTEHADPLIRGLAADGLITPDPVAGRGVHIDASGRAVSNRAKHSSQKTLNLFPVSPHLSKGDLMYPANKSRPPLSSSVAESVMGLQPLAKQTSQSIIEDLTGRHILQEREVEYLYGPESVTRIDRDS